MVKQTTNILISSLNCIKTGDDYNLFNYSFDFDVPAINVENNTKLKVCNFTPTASSTNLHGDAIYLFKIRGIVVNNSRFISNDGGDPCILSTTFNNSRYLYEENEIPLIKQTINRIIVDVYHISNSSLSQDAIIITAKGSGYLVGNKINFTSGGSYYSGLAVVSSTDNYGAITGINLISYGLGYITNPTIAISGVSGSGATIVATTNNYSGNLYKIDKLYITAGGSGYMDEQPIRISGTASTIGAGATFGTATLTSGAITNISITNGGSGYINGQYLTISGGTINPTNGRPAIITIIVNSSGTITGFNIIRSGNYSVAPTSFVVSNIPAKAFAIAPSGEITGYRLDDAGAGYTSAAITCALGGTGATLGTPNISGGVIVGIPITNGGLGYINGQYISITGGTQTTPPIIKAITNDFGTIIDIQIVNGGVYTANPTGASVNAGTGATFSFNPYSVIKTGQRIKGIHNQINFSMSLRLENDNND